MSFDSLPDRRVHGSFKWKRYPEDVIPLWVADMDFRTPECVTDALHKAVEHGIFGYTLPQKKLIGTIIDMLWKKYNWKVEASSIVWLPGLVSALNICCRAYTQKGQNIVTSTPIYPPFLEAPTLADRKLDTAELQLVNGKYEMDYETLYKVVTSKTGLYMLCNPHNPVGRSFSEDELKRLGDICLHSDTIICSDEIHCDLILDEKVPHTPIATLSKELANKSVTLMAPNKTWNLPGLGFSFAIIQNYKLRKRFIKTMKGIVPYPGQLGMLAGQVAYEQGEPWRLKLLEKLRENKALIQEYITQKMPRLKYIPGEATYLAWLDVRELELKNPYLYFLKKGVALSNGADFGCPGFLRLNFATTTDLIKESLERLHSAYQQVD